MASLALSNFQVTPYGGLVESTELNFRDLYMHLLYQGPDVNQATLRQSDPAVRMGETAVNNWAIYEGRQASNANLVASAKGMHMDAAGWYMSFVIVFEGKRFDGSTLQVMGFDSNDNDCEWGIIGGTGEFAMARGVIKRTTDRHTGNGKVVKLTIHGFCLPRSFPDVGKKDGPWGGDGDNEGDYKQGQEPRRLLSVTVHSGFVIDALEFSYVDQSGLDRTAGPWGGIGGHKETIMLGASEFIRNISGSTDNINGSTIVTSLQIIMNNNKIYEFGRQQGTSFSSSVPTTGHVTGFFGSSTEYLDSIGVYYA